MCDKKQKPPLRGMRCEICTGCGLCPGVFRRDGEAGGVHVLAEEWMPAAGLPEGETRRLAAADIGTTTIAMLLYGQNGEVVDRYLALNPQAVYGPDVLSRVKAASQGAGEEMRRGVRDVLGQGLLRFRRHLKEGEELYLTVAANTVMSYLFLGLDPAELGRAPFCASHLDCAQDEVDGVPCVLLPGLSAFVGGDIAAGIYACGMCERDGLTLLLDLGTNGEMVLGDKRRRIACATAAGPAFEGGAAKGVWGADMISLLARLRREGILDSTGLLAEPYFKRGIRIGNVTVTQEAVRSVQLAKGAIAAGIEILLQKFGVCEDEVERVVLAGGLGYYLKPQDCAQIGLLGPQLAKKACAGGNTALAGAFLAGRNLLLPGGVGALREAFAPTVLRTETVNLAAEPEFAGRYLEKMSLG